MVSDLIPEWMAEGAARAAHDREIRIRETRDWDALDEREQIVRTRAWKMRLDPTQAEARARRIIGDLIPGYEIVPQAVIGPYIADFLVPGLRLIIEIDGGYHLTERQMAKDAKRTRYLERAGYEVRRLTNDQVNAHWFAYYDG
jgi:very-short-patch-repair endonuclease